MKNYKAFLRVNEVIVCNTTVSASTVDEACIKAMCFFHKEKGFQNIDSSQIQLKELVCSTDPEQLAETLQNSIRHESDKSAMEKRLDKALNFIETFVSLDKTQKSVVYAELFGVWLAAQMDYSRMISPISTNDKMNVFEITGGEL